MHWHTLTFIAALRHDQVTAPLLLAGAMDGSSALAYVEQVLCPELHNGGMVICDNLSCHKVAGVRDAIEERGAELRYLPPYSPDLNPIEMAFAKLKASMRKAAKRNFEGLLDAVSSALDGFTSEHRSNFLRHAKYASD